MINLRIIELYIIGNKGLNLSSETATVSRYYSMKKSLKFCVVILGRQSKMNSFDSNYIR